MRKFVTGIAAGMLLLTAAGTPALAQSAGGTSTATAGARLSAGNSTSATSGMASDMEVQPNPITGVRKPPPGPAPQGAAAEIRLPSCAPPSCGTPQIMAP